jgi:hypothetical protein
MLLKKSDKQALCYFRLCNSQVVYARGRMTLLVLRHQKSDYADQQAGSITLCLLHCAYRRGQWVFHF